MYLTASLDQPLHHAGEGLNKLGHGHGHGGGMSIGEKGSVGSCVPLFIQAAHRRTISHEFGLWYCRRGSSENICTLLTHPRCIAPFHA